MGNEWKDKTLGEFVTLQRGHDLPEGKRTIGKVPILGSFGITGWHNESKATGPGVTIGRSGGSIGVVSYSPIDYWPLNTALYVNEFHGNYPKFAYYLLKSIDFTRFNSGSAQPSLNRNFIHPIEIKVPPLSEQKAIAHVLGSLDDRIELNRRMNETLEAMAQALFKSWFVDFDPVLDNAIASGKEVPEELAGRAAARAALGDKRKALPADIRALFPDEFILTDEMGWIPKGWEVKTISAFSDKISKGTTPRKTDISNASDPSEIPFIKVRDIDDKGNIQVKDIELIPRSIHNGYLRRSILKKGDILFSIAGTIGRTAIIHTDIDNSNINQAIAFVRPKKNFTNFFLLQHLRSENAQNIVKSKIIQAVQANVSLKELGKLSILDSGEPVIKSLNELLNPIYRKIFQIETLSVNLTNIRDTLLPKLLSGELRIPKGEV